MSIQWYNVKVQESITELREQLVQPRVDCVTNNKQVRENLKLSNVNLQILFRQHLKNSSRGENRVFLYLWFPGDAILDPKISCEIEVFAGKINRNRQWNKFQFSSFWPVWPSIKQLERMYTPFYKGVYLLYNKVDLMHWLKVNLGIC